MRKIASAFLVLFCASAAFALNANEKKIAYDAARSFPDALKLLEQVVNINSGTLNINGVRQVGEIFAAEFRAIGFQTSWSSVPPEMNRAGDLFAEHEGNHGKRILLIGHLDTVFEKESAFQPFLRKDSRAAGQGVNDMKGGDVVILYALKALQETGQLRDARIIVALMGDEEKPGQPVSLSRKALTDAAKRSDIALGFETAESMDTATIARRGVSSWILRATAPQSHSSGMFTPEVGSGSIFEISRILYQFHDQLRGEEYLTFNPGTIIGGTDVTYDPETSKGTTFGKTNVVARSAIAQGDLRFLSEQQRDQAQQRMKEIVSQHLPKTSAEIAFENSYPPMPPTEGNRKLLAMFDQVSRDLGYGKVEAYDPGGRGAADISFIASHVDGLDGLGVLGNGSHTDQEDLDLSTMPQVIQRTAVFLYRLMTAGFSRH
jgi:glutamate carboxypeptidase